MKKTTKIRMNRKKRMLLKLTLYQSELAHEMFNVEMQKNKLLGKLVFHCLTCRKRMTISDGYCSIKCADVALKDMIHDESPDVRIVRFIKHGNRKSYHIAIGTKSHIHEIKKLEDLDQFIVKRT